MKEVEVETGSQSELESSAALKVNQKLLCKSDEENSSLPFG